MSGIVRSAYYLGSGRRRRRVSVYYGRSLQYPSFLIPKDTTEHGFFELKSCVRESLNMLVGHSMSSPSPDPT